MSTETEERAGTQAGAAGRRAARARVAVVVAAVLSALLLGAAAGMALGLPGADRPTVPALDSVDVGFLHDMTVHHEQAVTMAGIVRDRSTDPPVRQLGYDMETTQLAEIGRMQGWLSLWGAPGLPLGPHMTWMPADGTHHHGAATAGDGVAVMPGMASGEELDALRSASGRELDVLFLQLMLRHHEGGTPMLEYAAEHAAVPQVRNLAAKMLAAQEGESDLMRGMLAERGAAPLPE